MDLLVHKCVALHDLCPVSHRVQFKPYGREEIVRIVEARVSDLNVFEEKCIEMVAARVANACAGDMRKALHALVEVCNAGESLLLRTRTTQQQQQQQQRPLQPHLQPHPAPHPSSFPPPPPSPVVKPPLTLAMAAAVMKSVAGRGDDYKVVGSLSWTERLVVGALLGAKPTADADAPPLASLYHDLRTACAAARVQAPGWAAVRSAVSRLAGQHLLVVEKGSTSSTSAGTPGGGNRIWMRSQDHRTLHVLRPCLERREAGTGWMAKRLKTLAEEEANPC